MSTETYWVVRNEGVNLWVVPDPEEPDIAFLDRTPSRREAEALAAEHGGHVVEVTVTERRVGLRWEPWGHRGAWLTETAWRRRSRWAPRAGRGTFRDYPSPTGAKAAAEAAVMEEWS